MENIMKTETATTVEVETIETSACKRIFKVGGHTLILYMITDGTPALSMALVTD